ncbi:MAG: hypothetical protein Q9212_005336 [Teloschistes hypoglaucus]
MIRRQFKDPTKVYGTNRMRTGFLGMVERSDQEKYDIAFIGISSAPATMNND